MNKQMPSESSNELTQLLAEWRRQMANLGPHGDFEFAPASLGNRSYVLVLSVIGVFVLILACINYVNLATARSATRAKEIGIRKVIGSDRSQLVRQHLAESLLLVFLALLLAMGAAQLLLEPYNSLLGKDMGFGLLTHWYGLPMLLGLGLFIGLLAGAYPAFYLTHYSPALILKGGETGGGRSTQRRLLVVFQFAVSIALIATTTLVYLQMRYTRTVDLGFDKEHVLVVSDAWRLQERRSLFEHEVETLAGVSEAVYVGDYPGSDFGGTNDFSPDSSGLAENVSLLTTWVSEGLSETLGIEFITGRDFSSNRSNDTKGIILNEAAVREFAFKDPLERHLYLPQYRWVKGEHTAGQWERSGVETFEVIGVVRDFHHFSLHREIPPLGILYAADEGMNLLVRFRPGEPEEAVSHVKSAWAHVAPDLPFEYGWLDEQYDAAYRSDERFATVVAIFAGLAVLLACLGILGLASFTAYSRRKEIGIRKVLGATAASIARLLTGDYVALVLLAFVLAVPLAYLGMSRWLENFAFRIEIGPAPFVVAGFLALGFALSAVSFHAVRASLTDPVETLKND